jgi:hypothetical protein
MLDNLLPILAPLLQRRYQDARRAYLSTTDYPWPQRRSRKRKPVPGVLDVADDEAG